MGDSDSGYQFGLGIGDEELARLEAQGTAIAPATQMLFPDSGLLGKVACLFGVHHWSEWTPADPEDPSKQVRDCTRCPRVKFNNGPVSFIWNYPIE